MGGGNQLSPSEGMNKEPARSDHQVQDELKEVADTTPSPGEGQELSDEDESMVNEVAEDSKTNQIRDAAQPPGSPHKQPPPLAGSVIRWERILPVRTLKILLVENDDSTRQVVSALLRNCSYEVTAVSNGLQAWKILGDLTNHIDLILTEVVMPGLTGIGLLSKIMSHKTWKNIPVIMMSSNDSMSTVFRCLSKGAVDFLFKPIRKNELKNLWQHVWRRCHSSCGSGSESGIQNQKLIKSKSCDDSGNSSESNDDDSLGLNARDGNDIGSSTQSSWTKHAAEVDSPQSISNSDQLAEPPDSTCALVIHPATGALCKDQIPKHLTGEKQGKRKLSGLHKNSEMQSANHPNEQDFTKLVKTKVEKLSEKESKNEGCMGTLQNNGLDVSSAQAAVRLGNQTIIRDIKSPSGCSKISEAQDRTLIDVPSLELSLKRLRSIGEGATATQDDRNVLRRSDLSAFSRYHTSAVAVPNQAPTGCGRSCYPIDNISEAIKTESNIISGSNVAPLNQGSNGSSNNKGMGSTRKNCMKPAAHKDKASSTPIIKSTYISAFHPVHFLALGSQEPVQENWENVTASSATGQPREAQHQVPAQHHHHHHYHHHHYHHVQSVQHKMQQSQNQNDTPPKSRAQCCGSSDVLSRQFEGNAANYSISESNSGSNHCSNGKNGSNSAVRVGGMNIESANGIAGQSGPGNRNGSGSGNGNGIDQNRFTQREVALKKFRLKRKERNFGKKVCYKSRKRLAEERPRVRGQFVRQSTHQQTGQDADR
ncbi:two-component response regulator-like PRR37 [Zingiber officinale]|uniref:two-component response regulator-like PRR37 n=1 Tax=Zingiber officinale TaxID=94328 RepID=UPI001C4D85EC|nr:two-component response regulator-like PRR37 [Zingiber officinale]XP_042427354.1 two-component response regulator-like PRR37 [Zingiber officinale]XP_042427355.1 two-component response regulator-like PRR37 [Zingiber officinale]